MASTDELRADIAELHGLRAMAKRARAQGCIDAAIATAEAELVTLLPSTSEVAGVASEVEGVAAAAAPAAEAEPAPAAPKSAVKAAAPSPAIPAPPRGAIWQAVSTFGLDLGGYNNPTVSVYVDLKGVGAVKDQVEVRDGAATSERAQHLWAQLLAWCLEL